MTDLLKLRNKIGDSLRIGLDNLVGDGTTTTFKLNHHRLITGSVYLINALGVRTLVDDANINYEDGVITITPAIGANVMNTVEYKYGAFRDEELQTLIDELGLKGAALEAISWLMADAARRYDYSTGIESFSPSQVFDHLKQLKKDIEESSALLQGSGGARLEERISDYPATDLDLP